MPMFITQKPWYLKEGGDELSHQRKEEEVRELEPAKKKYIIARKVHKFKKGACKNCGATDHKTKQCCERPRRKKAVHTGEDILGNRGETHLGAERTFEMKRDKWAGYDNDDYDEVVQNWKR